MFPTTVLLFCSFVAALQKSDWGPNLWIKIGATGLAAWAAVHTAAYWGVAP